MEKIKIICNENNEVIDGQGRLEACKRHTNEEADTKKTRFVVQDCETVADTLEEALEMARKMNVKHIAVLAGEGYKTVCVAEIEIEK